MPNVFVLCPVQFLAHNLMILSQYKTYHKGQKFGERKVWQIWLILPTLFAKHVAIQLLLSVF